MRNSPSGNPSISLGYQKDTEYSVQLLRWFLKPISAWPTSTNSSIQEKILSEILLVICFSLIFCTLAPCALGTFLEEGKDMETKLRDIGPLSYWILLSMKYCSLLMNVDHIGRCLQHMEMDWRIVDRVEDRETMLRAARIGRFMAGFSAIFLHGGMFSFNLAKAISTDGSASGFDNVSEHALPFAFYSKILDTRSSPAYEVVFTMQCVATFFGNSVTVGACGLAATLVMHACGQLRVLMSWLDGLIDGKGKEWDSAQRRMTSIVQRHLRILSFVARIEKIMHFICLLEIVGCTMHMCLLGYYCITEWDQTGKENIVAYCIILVSVTFNIFIFCYIGEILSEQSGRIGETAYMTDWYRLPGKTAIGLVLIILRSSRLVKITAGKMIQLSLATFGDVIKSSVAYLNILRTITV